MDMSDGVPGTELESTALSSERPREGVWYIVSYQWRRRSISGAQVSLLRYASWRVGRWWKMECSCLLRRRPTWVEEGVEPATQKARWA